MALLSELPRRLVLSRQRLTPAEARRYTIWVLRPPPGPAGTLTPRPRAGTQRTPAGTPAEQIGRASCRERAQISVVAVSLKKKKLNARLRQTLLRPQRVTTAEA